MVGLNGLEPSTSRLSGGRSNLLSYKPISLLGANPWLSSISLPFGGDNRDRTDDPLLAKQVLSQLSYTPVFPLGSYSFVRFIQLRLVTLCFSSGKATRQPILRTSKIKQRL